MKNTIRINIGCGQTPTKGWRNFDNSLSLRLAHMPVWFSKLLNKIHLVKDSQYEFIKFAKENNIEYCDATKNIPVKSGSVDVLYSCHMIEHLDQKEAKFFLNEARRVLASGGVIRLVAPDLRALAEQYLETNDADAFVYATRMTQSRPRTLAQRLWLLFVGTRHHQWMYDGHSLCKLLYENGFKETTIQDPGNTMISSPESLNLRERYQSSVYVEALNL